MLKLKVIDGEASQENRRKERKSSTKMGIINQGYLFWTSIVKMDNNLGPYSQNFLCQILKIFVTCNL